MSVILSNVVRRCLLTDQNLAMGLGGGGAGGDVELISEAGETLISEDGDTLIEE